MSLKFICLKRDEQQGHRNVYLFHTGTEWHAGIQSIEDIQKHI